MKIPVTYLTYLRFDPSPSRVVVSREEFKRRKKGDKPRSYFMHMTPPLRKGQEYYFHTPKRAANFIAKVARNWVKGGYAKVSGVVVKVNAVLPPLSATSLAELKANHEVFEVKP
jgi:hypothetical protein